MSSSLQLAFHLQAKISNKSLALQKIVKGVDCLEIVPLKRSKKEFDPC
jgi:hypothetical protein